MLEVEARSLTIGGTYFCCITFGKWLLRPWIIVRRHSLEREPRCPAHKVAQYSTCMCTALVSSLKFFLRILALPQHVRLRAVQYCTPEGLPHFGPHEVED